MYHLTLVKQLVHHTPSRLIGIANPRPAPGPERTKVLMPMTLPAASTKGPPEPGLIAVPSGSDPDAHRQAETVDVVQAADDAQGHCALQAARVPRAMAQPTSSASESPRGAAGGTDVLRRTKRDRSRNLRQSLSITLFSIRQVSVTASTRSTTWALVSTKPLLSMSTPTPAFLLWALRRIAEEILQGDRSVLGQKADVRPDVVSILTTEEPLAAQRHTTSLAQRRAAPRGTGSGQQRAGVSTDLQHVPASLWSGFNVFRCGVAGTTVFALAIV